MESGSSSLEPLWCTATVALKEQMSKEHFPYIVFLQHQKKEGYSNTFHNWPQQYFLPYEF